VGRISWLGKRYGVKLALPAPIGSIREDNSSPQAEIARYVAMLRGLGVSKSGERGAWQASLPPHLLDELEF